MACGSDDYDCGDSYVWLGCQLAFKIHKIGVQ